jgi:hypothetical protein
MSSAIGTHVAGRIQSVRLQTEPYPHFYVTDVFPADFYAEMLERLPTDTEFLPLLPTGASSESDTSDRYSIRFRTPEMDRLGEAKRAFWEELSGWLLGEEFLSAMASYIYPQLRLRFFGQDDLALRSAGSLSRTKQGFFVGPHTDARHKIFTLIFYLPRDDRFIEYGTSMWRPREPGFTCPGGPHHKFDRFEKISAMPFVPNSLFGFVKTEDSFHAVEPLQPPDFVRDTMVYGFGDARYARTVDYGV